MEKFADYREEGKTLIIVTHDLGTVRSMADRVVWLSYGEIKDDGDAGEVTATYAGDALGERHEDEGEHEFRFGSGEIVINHVTILGPDGQPTQKVKTGDDVTFRYEYEAQGAGARAGVRPRHPAHQRPARVRARTPATAATSPPSSIGPGTVDITITGLPLLPGTYDLSASVWDFPILHAYDQRSRVMRFDVLPGDRMEGFGLVTLRPEWSFSERVSVADRMVRTTPG